MREAGRRQPTTTYCGWTGESGSLEPSDRRSREGLGVAFAFNPFYLVLVPQVYCREANRPDREQPHSNQRPADGPSVVDEAQRPDTDQPNTGQPEKQPLARHFLRWMSVLDVVFSTSPMKEKPTGNRQVNQHQNANVPFGHRRLCKACT